MSIKTQAGRGSRSGSISIRTPVRHGLRRRLLPASLISLLGLAALGGEAFAGAPHVGATTSPTGGVVVGGAGSIVQQGANTIVNQQSKLLSLNWKTFNVGKDASVLFKQPSFTAVALNRILDQNPSQIFGHISSNGQVFLINTHGIIFGSSAKLNVGGLVASTLDLTPADFLSNHFNLDAHGGHAGIVNHGTIEAASGGSVSLVGGTVANDGLIVANVGRINLDGADRAVLDFDGDGLISVQVTGALQQRLATDQAAVANEGTLKAEGGTVVLQASAAKDLFTDLVNNSGVISAGGISTDGGTVRLVASGGNVTNSGGIDASGRHGGTVELLSDANVGVTGGRIDASGTQGGGSIRVGGGWQGGEGLQTAQATYVAADASLHADATQRGQGGSVVVWGDRVNNFYGSISARGGALGGDGGRVETSSHDGLNAQGSVDASASHGAAGTWLLDPRNVDIVAGGSGTLGGNVFSAPSNDSTIDPSVIDAALTGGTSVTVFTGSGGTQAGDITVTDPIVAAGAGTLYLKAAGSILLDAGIGGDGTDPLNVNLWANYGGTATATTYSSRIVCDCGVSVDAGITTAGGDIDIRTGDGSHAGGAVAFGATGDIDTGGGNLSITSTGITQQVGSSLRAAVAHLDTGTASATLAGANQIGTATLAGSGTADFLLNNGSNAITLDTVSLDSGDLTVSAGGGISLSGSGISTGGTQNYNNQVKLTGDTMLAGSTVTFFDGITGNHALTVDGDGVFLGTGTVDSLHVTGASTIGASLTTAGTQAYDGVVTLGADSYLGGTAVTLAGGVQGSGYALTIDGDASLAGSSDLGSIDVTGATTLAGSVTTSGAQAYEGAVTLAGDSTLDSGDTVDFGGAVGNDSGTTPRKLSITSTHGTTISGDVGAANGGLGGLTVDADTISLAGLNVGGNLAVTTHGGGIAQGSGWVVGGASQFDAGNQTISLASTDNDFGGVVSLRGTTAQITDKNALTLGALDLTGALSTISTGALNLGHGSVGGNLVATSHGGAIGEASGGLLVSGTSDLQAGGGAITLADGGNHFTGAVTAAGQGVSLKDAGDLTIASLDSGTNGMVNLTAGGSLNLPASAIDTGTASLTLAANGGSLSTAGALSGANVTLVGRDGITLDGDINSGGTLTLTSSQGAITQSGGLLAVGTLTGSSFGGTTLGQANLVDTLGDFTAAGFSLTNAQALTVSGIVDGGGSTSISTAGNLILSGDINGITTTLDAGGTIGQTDGIVTATTLNLSSVGGASLLQANQVANLGTVVNAGSGGLSFANATNLNLSGAVNVGTASGNDVNLDVAGGLTQSSGSAITADRLGGNVTGDATLGQANLIGTLGDFTAAGFSLANAQALTVSGDVDGGGSTSISTGGDLVLAGNINGTTTTLDAGGTIGQTGGIVTATTLNLSSTGGANLLQANQVTNLGTVVNTGSGGLSFANATNLNLSGAVNVGTASGNDVNLDVAGGLTQSSGSAITADRLGGNVTGDATLGQANLVGTLGDFTAASLSLSNAQALTVSGLLTVPGTLSLATTAGDLNLSTDLAAGMVELNSATALTLAKDITAGGLSLTAGGAISQTGGVLAVTGSTTVDANGHTITLTSAGNDFGDAVSLSGAMAQITDKNALTLGTLDLAGALVATSTGALDLGHGSVGDALTATSHGGAIGQSGALQVTGDSALDAGTGGIDLSDAGNDFTGTVGLSGGDATVTDKNALTLGTLDLAGALSASSTGALDLGHGSVGGTLTAASHGGVIGQSGALQVTGDSALDAGTGGIDLSDAGNDFTGTVGLSGGDATVTDKNALTLGTLDLTGALSASSTGALDLGHGSVGGTLTAASHGGVIGQSGALQVTGDSALDAGTGNIDLSDAGNDFTGTVGLRGGAATVTDKNALALGTLDLAGALSASSMGALDLGSGSVGGTLTAASHGGVIGQSGALQVTGESALDAGTGGIDLSDAGNDFTGTVGLSGGAATVTDKNALTLGTLDLTGALVATSTGALDLGSGTVGGALTATSHNGAIGQSGALQVTGNSVLDAGTGNIDLSNAGNDFTGTVGLRGGAATVTDKNALALGTLDLAGALVAGSTGALNLGGGSVGGTLTATSHNGAIGQSGALQVTGNSALDAGTGSIDLSNAGNDFVGTVGLDGSNATVTDKNALTLGTLDLAGALMATSTGTLDLGSGSVGGALTATSHNGAIGQSGTLQVTGAGTLDAGTGNIDLSNAGNDFIGTVGLRGGDAKVTDKNALTLGALNLTGALSASSAGTLNLGSGSVGGALTATSHDGAIGQSGALRVNGTSALDAGNGSVALADAGNDFVGAVAVEGDGVSLQDKNDLTLSGVTDHGNGDVSLAAGGRLFLPASGIDAGSGDLALASRGGALATAGVLKGGDVALNGQGGIAIDSQVTATGTLTLASAAGAVGESGVGAITAGTLAGNAVGAVTLGGANHVGTLAGFSAGSFSLANAQALTVTGPVDGGSNATLTTTSGNLAIDGTVKATTVRLVSAGTIGQGARGGIVATTLGGQSKGATTLDGSGNQVAKLGAFSAAGFSLVDGRSLDVVGAVDGGASTRLRTTSGNLVLDGAVSGTSTTLDAAGAIREGSAGSLTAGTLGGRSGGATMLDGSNHVGTLGDFSASGFSFTDAQALTVAGTLDGGTSATLATTSGDLTLNGTVKATDVALKSAGNIAEGANGSIVAGTLTGHSAGSTRLDPANLIDQLGDFSANGFALQNGKALQVTGTVDGGASLLLQTTQAGLAIDGTLDASLVTLQSAGAIDGGANGNIVAHTLTGSAQGATTLGTAALAMDNHVDVLGGFDSPAGFSFTNGQTLTLASVNGSAYTVNAGQSDLYLGVTGGDLLQSGTDWLYDGQGTWSSTGHIGLANAPIYVMGVTNQSVAEVGLPPAYFYAVDTRGNILPLLGAPSVNVPTSVLTSRSQKANGHGDAYIDASVVTANYRSFGIVPSGILLPPDQQDCQPGQPSSPDCPDDE